MRSKSTQNKSQNRLHFCSLCSYIAENEDELDHHYMLVHGEQDDVSYEIEKVMENKKAKKDLKSKAIKQLKLLINGMSFKDEFVGWCEQRYYVGRWGNAIILLPYATIC